MRASAASLVLVLAACEPAPVDIEIGLACVRVKHGDSVQEFPLARIEIGAAYAAGRRIFANEYLVARGELVEGIAIYRSDLFVVEPLRIGENALLAESVMRGPENDIACETR